ncbi:hypothetical protein PIB30_086347 [Stylosanthes scabra]|uniref:Uncharacterized protein n=1 Tax=Stylosanthes scabra TaxID=79078 RepID=A0ABU6WRF3_9FABA|nr:hypothetical protein [Stylosanthes scabra]
MQERMMIVETLLKNDLTLLPKNSEPQSNSFSQTTHTKSPVPPRSATDLFPDPLDSHPLRFKLASFLPLTSTLSHTSLSCEPSSPSIDLINPDYDFVSFSTKLVDVDSAVVRMRSPLVELHEKIEQFRGSFEFSLFAIKNGLNFEVERGGYERDSE